MPVDKRVSGELYRMFRDPIGAFSGITPDAVALLTASSADIALIVAKEGTIVDLAFSDSGLAEYNLDKWQGRAFSDIVTVESREKIEALLDDAAKGIRTRARQVNHPGANKPDLPINYIIISPPGLDYHVAFGHNLMALSEMQQRLVNAQLEMEEDYRRIRDAEFRYRLLFQLGSDPLLVVDGHSLRVSDANEAACAFFDRPTKRLVGAGMVGLVPRDNQARLQQSIADVRMRGREETVEIDFGEPEGRRSFHLLPFRETGRMSMLVRISDIGVLSSRDVSGEIKSLQSFHQYQPDAIVLVDKDGADRDGQHVISGTDTHRQHGPCRQQEAGQLAWRLHRRPSGADVKSA